MAPTFSRYALSRRFVCFDEHTIIAYFFLLVKLLLSLYYPVICAIILRFQSSNLLAPLAGMAFWFAEAKPGLEYGAVQYKRNTTEPDDEGKCYFKELKRVHINPIRRPTMAVERRSFGE